MKPEHWRIITPILLCVLTGLGSLNVWILNDIKMDVKAQMRRLDNHLQDPKLHYSIRSELDMFKKMQVR